MVSLLDKISEMTIEDYNPANVIEVVNSFYPLGKDKALKKIKTYLEHRSIVNSPNGLYWVLRVLFNVPEKKGYPPLRIGQTDIPPPANPEILPRFPVVIIRDVPFLVISSYLLGGLPEKMEDHVSYYCEHGILREHPLMPPKSLEGIEDEFLYLWKAAYGEKYITQILKTIKSQVDRLSE
jgi:hypothetical protein